MGNIPASMKRPLLMVGVLFVAGILVGGSARIPVGWVLAAAFTSVLAAVVWPRGRAVLLGAGIVLAGWTDQALHTQVLSPKDLRRILGGEPALGSIRGIVRETPTLRVFIHDERESWRAMARIEVSALSTNHQAWQPACGCVAVTTPGTLTNCFGGQEVEITGVIAPPRIASAEGTFDYRAYLKQLGVYYHLRAGSELDWRMIASPARPPLADQFRAWARRALAAGLPIEDESLRLEWALALGWKTGLTDPVADPFMKAATYHIFAVDGLRMAIVFGIFFSLFRALRVPRPACALVLVPLIWFYVALTGWPASAIRATIMLTVVIGGWVLKRPPDLLNSLFAAALTILIWEPQQISQAGFQLSFLVVLSMILILPPLRRLGERLTAPDPLLPQDLHPRWRRTFRVPLRWLGDLCCSSFAAWVGSLPLVACYFHLVTPVSTPANLVAVPLCGLVLMSNLSSLLLSGWFPAAAELFNHAGWFLMEGIRVSSHWFAGWPGAWRYAAAPSLFSTALFYAVLLALTTGWLLRPEGRRWKFALLTCALTGWIGQCWWHVAAVRITILPLSGGHGEFCRTAYGHGNWLVDSGSTNAFQLLTKPFLEGQGVNRLDGLALTHGDVRHVGGAELMARIFPPRQVYVSPVRFRSPAYRRAVEAFKTPTNWLHTVQEGDAVGPWRVLYPRPDDRFAQADDNALVLLGTFPAARVLLVSDLGRPGQNALIERTNNLRADLVVTGIPSASEALGESFLDAVRPKVIIVADSEYPSMERARPELRERLEQRGIPVLYTRVSGAITIELRGRRCALRAMDGTRVSFEAGELQTEK